MPSARRPDKGCPGCGRPAEQATAPFCSAGCRDRDLIRWLSDDYRIPGPPAAPSDFGRDGLDSDG